MGARRLPFGGDPVDLELARPAGGVSVGLTLQHARNGVAWTVTLPAACGASLLRVTADGDHVVPQITRHGEHRDVTTRGVFGAARTVIVRLSCRRPTLRLDDGKQGKNSLYQ